MQGEAGHPCPMYSECTEFDKLKSKTNLQPLYFVGTQQIRETYFKLHVMLQNGTFEGCGAPSIIKLGATL